MAESKAQLIHDLTKTSIELDILILETRKLAVQQGGTESEWTMRTRDGQLMLAPLVTAKANAQAALAQLRIAPDDI